jgi:hypothetical protein
MKKSMLAGIGIVAVAVVSGAVVAFSGSKRESRVLAVSGATIAKVGGAPRIPGPGDEVDQKGSLIQPGPSPETGFVLRNIKGGPWWKDRVTTNDASAGDEYVTSRAKCNDALVVGGSTGATRAQMDTVDPPPPSMATVWRNTDGASWKKIPIAGLPPHSMITGLTNGSSFGKPELLVASARTLTKASDAFALLSVDCGKSWAKKPVPLGTAKGFEYAVSVTAGSEGFVMAGSINGVEKDSRTIALWRSNDGNEWTATSLPETPFARYVPQQVATYDKSFVIVNGDSPRSDSRFYEWTGSRDSWFTAETVTPKAEVSVGAVAATDGIYVLQTQEETGSMFLVRRAGDEPISEELPGINARDYDTLQFFGHEDSLWIVGQRRNTAKLESWLITLPAA